MKKKKPHKREKKKRERQGKQTESMIYLEYMTEVTII